MDEIFGRLREDSDDNKENVPSSIADALESGYTVLLRSFDEKRFFIEAVSAMEEYESAMLAFCETCGDVDVVEIVFPKDDLSFMKINPWYAWMDTSDGSRKIIFSRVPKDGSDIVSIDRISSIYFYLPEKEVVAILTSFSFGKVLRSFGNYCCSFVFLNGSEEIIRLFADERGLLKSKDPKINSSLNKKGIPLLSFGDTARFYQDQTQC